MIKNYKTFLNIILSLSLVLIPGYGYPQVNDSADSKNLYLEHILQYFQKKNPDFNPPPEFRETLRMLMEMEELTDYLDQSPDIRSRFNVQSLKTSGLNKAFHFLRKIRKAAEKGELEDYLDRNPDLIHHLNVLSLEVSAFKRALRILIEMGGAIGKGDIRNYLNQNPELLSYAGTTYGYAEEQAFYTLLLKIEEATTKGKIKKTLKKNRRLRYIFEDMLFQYPEFRRAFFTLMEAGAVIEQGGFKDYVDQHPELRSYFNNQFLQVLDTNKNLLNLIKQEEITEELENHLAQNSNVHFNFDDQFLQNKELKKTFRILREIGESIGADKLTLDLSEVLIYPVSLSVIGLIHNVVFENLLKESFTKSVNPGDFLPISVFIASGVMLYHLVKQQTLSKAWNQLTNRWSSPYYKSKKDIFFKINVTVQKPTVSTNKKLVRYEQTLIVSTLAMNMAFMYLFYIADFAKDINLGEALLITGAVIAGVTYLSKNWNRLKNKISSSQSSIQQKSVVIEGVATEMEAKSPGVLKRALDACAGMFTKSENTKDEDKKSS